MRTSMKTVLAAVAVIILSTGLMARADQQELPKVKEVVVGINDAYIPGGFDSDSEAYVVTSGIFPNGCYTYKRSEVSHVDNFNHEVRSVAAVSQGMCLMVLVPFTKEVKLGKLNSGKHTLKFLNGDGTYLEKTMAVE
jgi:hypothetical protein